MLRGMTFGLAVVGLTAGAATAQDVAPQSDRDTAFPLVAGDEPRAVPRTQAEITLSFSPVVKQAAPAVVNIYTRKTVERRLSPFRDDPFFDRFFRDMFPGGTRQRVENTLGSGVIVDPSGIVVSNHHVVAGADEIVVVLADRREFQGRVIFADRESDLAVVQLEGARNLPTLTLRDSDTLEVGDLVLAIGNPFGVGQTVTAGIISALARSRTARDGRAGVFLQTDAAINPGNSGGALVDMKGRLVGINTAILSRSGGSNGIGFAVPANLVARVVASAEAGQTRLVRPWLGVEGRPVDGALAEALGIPTPRGFVIEDMHPTSALAAAGLRRGDVVTAFDGAAVNTPQELAFRAATKPLGSRATVRYLRDGDQDSAVLALAAPPETPPRDERRLGGIEGLPGATVINVNPAVIETFGLDVTARGVLIAQAAGPARRIGLRRGDFIRAVNGHDTPTVDALIAALSRVAGVVRLTVERGGRRGQITYRR